MTDRRHERAHGHVETSWGQAAEIQQLCYDIVTSTASPGALLPSHAEVQTGFPE